MKYNNARLETDAVSHSHCMVIYNSGYNTIKYINNNIYNVNTASEVLRQPLMHLSRLLLHLRLPDKFLMQLFLITVNKR